MIILLFFACTKERAQERFEPRQNPAAAQSNTPSLKHASSRLIDIEARGAYIFISKRKEKSIHGGNARRTQQGMKYETALRPCLVDTVRLWGATLVKSNAHIRRKISARHRTLQAGSTNAPRRKEIVSIEKRFHFSSKLANPIPLVSCLLLFTPVSG